MPITAGAFVNDDESGLHEDTRDERPIVKARAA